MSPTLCRDISGLLRGRGWGDPFSALALSDVGTYSRWHKIGAFFAKCKDNNY